jgi:hypothetical protein
LQHGDDVVTDLVEYLIVGVATLDALAALVPALAELATSGVIRVLDLAAVTRHRDGTVEVLEVEAVESLAELAEVDGQVGALLSEHDLAMASVAIEPGTAAIVVVTEDRWAAPLSAAARLAGGRIVGGERIPPARVVAVLSESSADEGVGS